MHTFIHMKFVRVGLVGLDPKLAVCLTNSETDYNSLAGDSCISSDNL